MNHITSNIDDILNKINHEIVQSPEQLVTCAKEISIEIYNKNIQKIKSVDFDYPFKKIKKIILYKTKGKSFDDRVLIYKLIIFIFAANLKSLLKNKKISEDIFNLYPIYMERLLEKLLTPQNVVLNESYSSALQFAMGLTVPCGAQVVDLRSKVPFKSIIKTLILNGDIKTTKQYFVEKAWGRWYRIHTDSNYLSEFNEIGWETCYIRISKMLRNDLDVRGMVGTSWFYDPQLLSISPHLSYLQKTPIKNGAFFIKHGASAVDVERALRTSKTRRRYYNEGKYSPTCYSLIWTRDEIISWAESIQHI
jgi:hypothetical protein